MSICPQRVITESTTPGIDADAARSPATVRHSTPRPSRCERAASSSSCLRAVTATRAPISPNPSAIWRPMPREPPVTSAVLPLKSRSSLTPTHAPARVIPPRYRRAGVSANYSGLQHGDASFIFGGDPTLRVAAIRRVAPLLPFPGSFSAAAPVPVGLGHLLHRFLRIALAPRPGRARRRRFAPGPHARRAAESRPRIVSPRGRPGDGNDLGIRCQRTGPDPGCDDWDVVACTS